MTNLGAALYEQPVSAALLTQESGNNPNSPTSVDGAVGQAQITPGTWKQYASAGEDINNPADNLAVHGRIVSDLAQKAKGDPARIAVGYFSGPGNIASPDSPTPWKKDVADGNGKTVSSYVSDVTKRLAPPQTLDLGAELYGNTQNNAADSNPAPQGSNVRTSMQAAGDNLDATVGAALKDIGRNSLESLKNTATQTGQAISEPLNNPNANGVMAIPDAAVRTLGKAGNAIAGAAGALFSPVTGALTASAEATVPAQEKILGIPDTMKLSPAQVHQIAQEEGSWASAGVGAAMGAGKAKIFGAPKSSAPANTSRNLLLNNESGSPLVIPKLLTDQSSGGVLPKFMQPEEPLPESVTQTDSGSPLKVQPKAADSARSILKTFAQNDTDAQGNPINFNQVADRLQEMQKTNPDATALDAMTKDVNGVQVAGRNISLAAKAISNTPGQAAGLAGDVAARGLQATKRIGNSFNQAISSAPFYKVKNDAIQQMEGTGQMYKDAFTANQNMNTPKINQLLARPAGQAALRKAATTMQNDGSLVGVSDPDLVEQAALTGQPSTGSGIASGLKMRTLHYVKQALFDMAESPSSYNQFGKRNAEGSAYMGMYHDLLKEMKSNDVTATKGQPGLYEQANSAYSTPARVQTALEKGRSFGKLDPEEIQAFVDNKNISNPEKVAFAAGVRRSLQDTIDNVRDGTNPVQQLWKQSLRDRLKPLFPDSKAFKVFAETMQNEQTMARNDRLLATGSPTASNVNFNEMFNKGGMSPGNIAKTIIEPQGALANYVGAKLDKAHQGALDKMSNDTKTIFMRYMTTKDPSALRDLAKRINQK